MKKLFRPATVALLVGIIVLVLGMYGVGRLASGDISTENVAAQTSTPTTTTPVKPPASQPVTVSPLTTIQSFMDAVQAGDMDIVSTLTGGKEGALGIISWNAKDLIGFVGHTTFGRWRNVITHNDGQTANVNIDGFMTFTDPGGFPAVKNVIHLYIDGDFKLKANGTDWVITGLPGYQEPLCDHPNSWGPDPNLFPWPGDAI